MNTIRKPSTKSKPEHKKTCIKCGCQEFYSNRKCKQCAKELAKKWKKNNPEKVKTISAAHYQKNKDRLNSNAKVRYEKNKDSILAKQKIYKSLNPEKVKEIQKKCQQAKPHLMREAGKRYRAKFPDRARASTKNWEDRHPESNRIRCVNRRARKIGNGGNLSKGLFERLFSLQKGKCACCHADLSYKNPRSPMDHIIPISKGGMNVDSNIQLLCRHCNSSKHAKDPIEFMQSRGFLL